MEQPEARRLVAAGMCPWCPRGPFRSIAKHTNAAHGVDGRRLRETIGVPWTASICSPELTERRRELNGEPGRREAIRALRGVATGAVSPAGREVLRRNAAVIPVRPGRRRTISDGTRAAVREAVRSGVKQTDVAAAFGVAESTVSRILRGR